MRYIIFALLIACTACASTPRWPAVDGKATLAVAHVVHPQNDWELMAGVLPEEASVIPGESLVAMDGQLAALLEKSDVHAVLDAATVQKCEEIVLADDSVKAHTCTNSCTGKAWASASRRIICSCRT